MLKPAEKAGNVSKTHPLGRPESYQERGHRKGRTRERVAKVPIDPGKLRKPVREQARKLLPRITREEVEAALR